MTSKKDFKPVYGMCDLAQFGINPLTGEACTYSMRTLCDVNEDGKQLLSEFLGMPNIELARNWNSTVAGKPSIGSIMLTHSLVHDLAKFAFFSAGALSVVVSKDSTNGIFDTEMQDEYATFCANPKVSGYSMYRNSRLTSQAPMQGSRNVHAATGRVQ